MLKKAVIIPMVLAFAAEPARSSPLAALWGYAQIAADEAGEPVLPPGTYRIPVRFGREGRALRLTFANLDGNPPLAISAVTVERDGKAVTARFGSQPDHVVARGQVATTDPIAIPVAAGQEAIVTVTTLTPWRPVKGHGGVSMTFAPTGGGTLQRLAVRPFLTLVAGEAPPRACTILALGDSITDGDAGTTNVRGWPGRLAERFAALPPARRCSVVNMGIGGNRLLADGRGQAALARFDRDVLAVPGVTHLIYMEGINDLARSGEGGEPVLEHMMLQADQPLAVWGWADPGEQVTVTIAGRRAAAIGGSDGRWRATLPPLKANAVPITLTVKGRNTLKVGDVLVGQVWLAGGQSNMDKPIGPWPGQQPVKNWEAILAGANRPQLRFFDVADAHAEAPADDVAGKWFVATPETLRATHFSAVAYLFARMLSDGLKQPAAVINTAVGGTRIEPWIPAADFARQPSLAGLPAWWKTQGTETVGEFAPSSLYNAMVAPLTGYGVRGLLWYQGESNVIRTEDGAAYAGKMVALVAGWRRAWGKDLPFYYAQISPFLYHIVVPDQVASAQSAARLMAAQAAAQPRIANSGMVVTTDLVDDLTDIHPVDKEPVARRLANWALARTYGRNVGPVDHPRFAGLTIEGDRAIVAFDHAEGLRVASGNAPSWFMLAGTDGVFHPARARIDGTRVILTSAAVAAPRDVRFGWDEGARPNLANGAGLAVVPFRTDHDER